jgi:hypothetical protein
LLRSSSSSAAVQKSTPCKTGFQAVFDEHETASQHGTCVCMATCVVTYCCGSCAYNSTLKLMHAAGVVALLMRCAIRAFPTRRLFVDASRQVALAAAAFVGFWTVETCFAEYYRAISDRQDYH